jgi:hypothetical protein
VRNRSQRRRPPESGINSDSLSHRPQISRISSNDAWLFTPALEKFAGADEIKISGRRSRRTAPAFSAAEIFLSDLNHLSSIGT